MILNFLEITLVNKERGYFSTNRMKITLKKICEYFLDLHSAPTTEMYNSIVNLYLFILKEKKTDHLIQNKYGIQLIQILGT